MAFTTRSSREEDSMSCGRLMFRAAIQSATDFTGVMATTLQQRGSTCVTGYPPDARAARVFLVESGIGSAPPSRKRKTSSAACGLAGRFPNRRAHPSTTLPPLAARDPGRGGLDHRDQPGAPLGGVFHLRHEGAGRVLGSFHEDLASSVDITGVG